MATKHTPGPWEINDGEIIASGSVVAQVMGADDFPCLQGHGELEEIDEAEAECRANACLIAAAPDLLAACIAVVEQDVFAGSGLMRKRIEAMKAAIAKATK